MTLPDGPRQIAAGLAAALGFLALFYGAGLVWWLALLLAVLVYGALLLVIGRRAPLDEIQVAERVSAADVVAAGEALGHAAARVEQAAGRVAEADRATLDRLARGMHEVQRHILDDPEDYRVARRFIRVHLPSLLATVEGYAAIAGSTDPQLKPRLDGLSGQIASFVPLIERINRACVEKDLSALEVEASTLLQLMNRP